MDAAIQLYTDQLEELRTRLKEAVQGMSQEELNWAPPVPETNSPYVLAFHLPGSESMWFHQVIGGMENSRNRDAEFTASGGGAAALIERIDKVAATSAEVLGKLAAADLDQPHTNPSRPGSEQVTARWCIVHMIEHYSEHLGHLDLTKQLWKGR